MTTKAKKEIPHEELDKNEDKKSARYIKIDSEQQVQVKGTDGKELSIPFVLIDKVIYEINVCPHCGSNATFHRRIQETGDVTGNVWQVQQFGNENGFDYRKFDYCLDCHKDFLIELYIWKRKSHYAV